MPKHALFLALLVALLLAVLAAGQSPDEDPPQRQLRPRRMYFGAPPAVPHDLGPDMSDCLLCHGDPDMGAPLTPHPTRLRCRQCHVAAEEEVTAFRANQLVGLPPPGRAPRVQPAGPPLIPHAVLLRENCLACHDPELSKEIIPTTHPERLRCRQCHMPQRAALAPFSRAR